MRRCRGTLLVCGGLSGLVGLGDTCRIEPRSHNQGECPSAGAGDREPLLSEVVASGEVGVHLLPFGDPAGRGDHAARRRNIDELAVIGAARRR